MNNLNPNIDIELSKLHLQDALLVALQNGNITVSNVIRELELETVRWKFTGPNTQSDKLVKINEQLKNRSRNI